MAHVWFKACIHLTSHQNFYVQQTFAPASADHLTVISRYENERSFSFFVRRTNSMNQINVQRQSDRRAEILQAAQRCFVRSGFHQTSMQEICAEAGMSPGNLYRYFASKEALITGIVEANRAEAAASFIAVQQAPDFFAGLAALARHHLVERPVEKVAICAEGMTECLRTR